MIQFFFFPICLIIDCFYSITINGKKIAVLENLKQTLRRRKEAKKKLMKKKK
jgi:hypothetical protein